LSFRPCVFPSRLRCLYIPLCFYCLPFFMQYGPSCPHALPFTSCLSTTYQETNFFPFLFLFPLPSPDRTLRPVFRRRCPHYYSFLALTFLCPPGLPGNFLIFAPSITHLPARLTSHLSPIPLSAVQMTFFHFLAEEFSLPHAQCGCAASWESPDRSLAFLLR